VTVNFFYQFFLTKSSFYCQLLGAPKIYKEDVSYANGYQWHRQVDFTPSCRIGQSSTLCLELPHEGQLPNFLPYEENEGQFVLLEGSNFSCNSGLVPIVNPPPGFNLPYKILFKIKFRVGVFLGQQLISIFVGWSILRE
jgi:RNA-dependent RNA polymerase